jgi:hypothetical protein
MNTAASRVNFSTNVFLYKKLKTPLQNLTIKIYVTERERERVIPWDNQFLVLDSISYNKPIAGKEVIYGKLNCNFFFFNSRGNSHEAQV